MTERDLPVDRRAEPLHRDLRVRPMVEGDAPDIHDIHCACLTQTLAAHYTRDQIAAWMKGRSPAGYITAAKAGERFFVAVADGRVVGFASWQDDELLALYVHPDAQGRGVGSRLLDACLKDAAAEGAAITGLKAAVGADPFYARRGFVAVGPGGTLKNGVVIQDTRMVRPGAASSPVRWS